MRVFVTGATGFVGTAVVAELIAAGHEVLGLARSEASAEALTHAGATVHRGDLEDIASLRTGAAAADAVIHTGFIHDFARYKEVCETDCRVIEAIGAELAGTEKPFIITSGIGLLPSDRTATEQDAANADNPNPRIISEQAADKLAGQGVRVSVVRLPPSVHGAGDHGFVPILIDMAKQKGKVVYSDLNNDWAAVHRKDAATLYRLALEKDAAPGTRYHAMAEEKVPFTAIVTAIAKRLGIPVEQQSADEAAHYFGWFAHFAAMNVNASSQQTRDLLRWTPTEPGLIADIDSEAYFPG